MPTESKSETPRMQAVQFTCHCLLEDKAVPFKDAEQLEKELNEANLKCARERRISLAQSNLAIKAIEERNTLAKELADAKEIINIERQHREVNNEVQLAKENKVMREALEEIISYCDGDISYGVTDIRHVKACAKSGLIGAYPNSLIVLTRNELIAEIEKMPCGCKGPEKHYNMDTGEYEPHKDFIKCHRCKWIDELKSGK